MKVFAIRIFKDDEGSSDFRLFKTYYEKKPTQHKLDRFCEINNFAPHIVDIVSLDSEDPQLKGLIFETREESSILNDYSA